MIAGTLTTTEFALHRDAVALIPFGSFEQHGPHLPLLTDTIIAEEISRRVEVQTPDTVLLYPAIWFGDSLEHRGFPGTLSVGAVRLMQALEDIFSWLEQSGIRRAVLYNAHGGNVALADAAAQEWSRGSSLKVVSAYAYPKPVRDTCKRLFGVSQSHAGSTETSLLYALRPDLRRDPAASLPNPQPYDGGNLLDLFETRELSESGVLQKGDTIEVDPKKGDEVATAMTAHLASLVSGFRL